MKNSIVLFVILIALIPGCTKFRADREKERLKESQKIAVEKKDQYRMDETFENDKAQIIDLIEGRATFEINYKGNSTFTCRLLNNVGDLVDILADNRPGPFKDTTTVTVPKTSSYILDVRTTGFWSVYRK